MKIISALLLVGVSAVALSTSAYAQSTPTDPATAKPSDTDTNAGIADIIVTAQKREERLQSVPVAVTAFSQEQLRTQRILQPSDLQYSTPGLNLNAQGSGGADYQIRGQGVIFGGGQSVITYFAGAPGGGGAFNFFDLANVQVLKGPQGTLFGRTSTGGAVLFEPSKPGNEFDGYIDGSLGNLNYRRLEGAINVPIIKDVLAVRVAGFIVRRDGDTLNLITGQRLQNQHREGFRISALLTPGDIFESQTIFDYGNANETGKSYQLSALSAGSAPLDPAFFNFAFNSPASFFGYDICGTTAAINGVSAANLAAFNAGCVAQRGALYNQGANAFRTELARLNSSDAAKRQTNAGQPGFFLSTNWVINNRTTLKLGGSGFVTDATVKNIFSYGRDGTASGANSGYDFDGTPERVADTQWPSPVLTGGPCVTSGPNIGQCSYPVYGAAPRDADPFTLTEEVNVSAKFGGKLDLIAGYFYLRTKQNGTNRASFAIFNNVLDPGLAPIYTAYATTYKLNTERGLFVQGTLDLSDWLLQGLSVTAGYRNTKLHSATGAIANAADEITRTATNIINDATGNNRTFNIKWQANRNLLIYARSSTGFKPGGNNGACLAENNPVACPLSYSGESVKDYEAGIKADYDLGPVHARTNLAVYSADYKNIQRSTVYRSIQGASIGLVANSAAGRIRGLEIEQILRVSGLTLNAGFSYTDAKYTKFFFPNGAAFPCTDPVNNSNNNCVDASNSPYPYQPKYQFNLGAQYNIPIDESIGIITPSIQYSHKSSAYYGTNAVQSAPTSFLKSYGLLNARISWNNMFGHPIDATVFADNITNTLAEIHGNDLLNNIGFAAISYGPPRTYGVQLRFRFGKSAN
jgi:iron complex outermembrane recepter protein